MDMQTIIKNNVGSIITNKLTGETARISGVEVGDTFKVFVSDNGELTEYNFIQFVSKYNLDFIL